MEREQIIKALECCAYGGDITKSQVEVCSPCPYFHEGNCTDILKENALSLIKELTEEKEQLVKDLAEEIEENNRLTTENDKILTDRFCISIELDAMRGVANSYKMHNEKLTEENERLRAESVAIPKGGIGNLSDGYHTFNELYHHRAILFSVICNAMPDKAWKSKLHDTGDMYDGMFIVGIETPKGQATYHYDIEPYWDMFKVKELEKAPKWDGHTPQVAIERIAKLNIGAKIEALEAELGKARLWTDLYKSEAQEVPIKAERMATVRKMQERVNELVENSGNRVYTGRHIHLFIDQIAKEMLEGV